MVGWFSFCKIYNLAAKLQKKNDIYKSICHNFDFFFVFLHVKRMLSLKKASILDRERFENDSGLIR